MKEKNHQSSNLLQLLHQTIVAANQAPTVEEAWQSVVEQICVYSGWPVGHVYLFDVDMAEALVSAKIWYFDQPRQFEKFRQITETSRFLPGAYFPGRVFTTGKPTWMLNIADNPDFLRAEQARETGLKIGFAVPVLADEKAIAVLEFFSYKDVEPSGQFLEVMTYLGIQIGHAIEHKRTKENLERSRRRLQALFEHALDAILMANDEARIVEANPAACELLDYDQPQLLQMTVPDITPLFFQEQGQHVWQQLITQGQYQGTYLLHRKDGHIIETENRAVANILPGLHVSIARDVTQRKRVEQILAHRVREMEVLYETSLEINRQPDVQALLNAIVKRATRLIQTQMGGLFLMKSDGEVLERVAGYNLPESSLGIDIPLGQGLVGRVAQTGEPLVVSDYNHWKHRLGPTINDTIGRILGVPLTLADRVIGVLSVFDPYKRGKFEESDIRLLKLFAAQASTAIENARLFAAAKRRAEENARLYETERRLRHTAETLSHQLLTVQENERRHIARELHDEVGQILTGLKFLLDISANLPAPKIKANLVKAQELVGDLMDRVDELSLNLRPAMLDDLGLLPTLLWHFERYSQQTSIEVKFNHRALEERRFAPEVETAAYRIVQEALTNVARYAQASEVMVQIWAREGTLALQIEDEGVGFDPDAPPLADETSSGLSGMRERAALLGGELAIESTPGIGTCVTAQLPIADDHDKEQPP